MFVPGGWYLNSDELARNKRLKSTEFLLNIIYTFVSELANGPCVILKITALTLNDEDPSL